jgi:xanthine dehydrogenase accessory factor
VPLSMSDPTQILDAIVAEVDAGRQVAVCAVVATRGSAPQVPGALVCVDQGGRIVGTVGGGCGEAEVRRRALELLAASESPETQRRQDVAEDGACHGQAQRRHVESDDEQHAGASGLGMAPIRQDMAPDAESTSGTGWHGRAKRGHEALGELLTLTLDHDFGFDDGLICGGQMDVAISVISQPGEVESFRQAADAIRNGGPATLPVYVQATDGPVEYRVQIEAPPKLIIAGGGHLGKELASRMVSLGFHVSVIDDRSDFANAERYPPPINPVAADIETTLAGWPIDTSTFVVIVTRGHKHDEQALSAVLNSPAKYIGMIGSRRKIKVIYDDLLHAGATQQQLDRVHAPIGLDIKAVTPEEIAVSIAAELISIRRADHKTSVEGPIRLPDHGT